MLKTARRAVKIAAAKPAIARYGNVVGVGPDNGLNIGIDVGDITAIVDVLTANIANTDDVAGGRDSKAGLRAYAHVTAACVAVNECLVTYGRVFKAARIVAKSSNAHSCVSGTINVVQKGLITDGRIEIPGFVRD